MADIGRFPAMGMAQGKVAPVDPQQALQAFLMLKAQGVPDQQVPDASMVTPGVETPWISPPVPGVMAGQGLPAETQALIRMLPPAELMRGPGIFDRLIRLLMSRSPAPVPNPIARGADPGAP